MNWNQCNVLTRAAAWKCLCVRVRACVCMCLKLLTGKMWVSLRIHKAVKACDDRVWWTHSITYVGTHSHPPTTQTHTHIYKCSLSKICKWSSLNCVAVPVQYTKTVILFSDPEWFWLWCNIFCNNTNSTVRSIVLYHTTSPDSNLWDFFDINQAFTKELYSLLIRLSHCQINLPRLVYW